MNDNFYFRGVVKPYLQGHNTLSVINRAPGFLDCYLGSKRTRIRLRDFRSIVCQAGKQALKGQEIEKFAQIFSQPAQAKIRLAYGKVQIDLHESDSEKKAPMLWLGVVQDGETIPIIAAHWDIVRSVGKSKTGFVILFSE